MKWTVLRGFEYMVEDLFEVVKTALKWAVFLYFGRDIDKGEMEV